MLKRIQKGLAKRKARKRRATLHVRPQLERLEVRAMLSASYGQMPQAHGGADLVSQRQSGPRFADTGAYSQAQHLGGHDGQSAGGVRDSRPSRGGSRNQDGPASQMYGIESSPPPSRIYGGRPQLTYYYVTANPYGDRLPMQQRVHLSPEPNFADPLLPKPEPVLLPTPISFSPFYFAPPVIPNLASNSLQRPNVPTVPILNDQLAGVVSPTASVPSAADVLAFASTLTDLPALQQVGTRDTNTVANLSAVARDVAFQGYAPTLYLAATSNSYDRADVGAFGADLAASEILDGFIRPAESSIENDTVRTTDALTREREAVDKVLRDLREIETQLPADTNVDAPLPNGKESHGQLSDVQIETTLEEATDDGPANGAEGGMVLLEARGDANAIVFDLTPAYADGLERFEVRLGMEASVGFYQAIDVAVDEASSANDVQSDDSVLELNREMKLDDNLPVNAESSSEKAAALIGATTLTGAMVWMNRAGSESRRAAAQKRRAGRG